MTTRFQTMLAPIGLSTGDGRRFAGDAITLAEVPFPFEWARSREGGHDGAVVVGVVQEAAVLTVKDAVAQGFISAERAKGMDQAMSGVWARGELFDGVSREEMPRLAEDVAEAMHLIGAGTLGPSVDLDSFEGVPVMEGTDEPVTWEDIEAHYEETGEEPKIELLVTAGRVRAATLVSIPAFAETSRPLELAAAEVPEDEEERAAQEAALERTVALVASMSAGSSLPEVARFDRPALDGPTPITWDWETGRVYGHIATWSTCHVGYSDVCVTAPKDESGAYAAFNRFPVDTEDGGTVWAGRITVGGRHAGLSLNASATMSAYDGKTVAAYVRAYEDEFGIVVAGAIQSGLGGTERAAIDRRKVSGDWRETPAGLSLVEVLALSPGPRAHAEPGFPIPGTFSRAGRQVALTAALGPMAEEDGFRTLRTAPLDIQGAVRAALAEDRAVQAARSELAQELEPVLAAEAVQRDEERAKLARELEG
ncbi:Pas7 [Actinoplanes phage phiAsp2]|uniref:Pas7 n=1 Tax=Actinoplanes phage phiAsp2 TaxID=279303 RepID=Q6J824_9CAUD|nr:Pas7 [Actinoplanes phage phiAsp2]AAT36755.1 Pas7 [Actinoplanes phage phiAsp2]